MPMNQEVMPQGPGLLAGIWPNQVKPNTFLFISGSFFLDPGSANLEFWRKK